MLTSLLKTEHGITAVIGSGGKTTLLHTLARELSQHGTVILATTTHFFPSAEFPWLNDPSVSDVREALLRVPVVQLGSLQPSGKLAPCSLDFGTLAALADYVLVEADGSKQLPLKAHGPHEPVIPQGTRQVLCVVGASGFGKAISEVVHRPERFCALVGAASQAAATPELVAEVLEEESLADMYLINQADKPDTLACAQTLAAHLKKPVFAGSLASGHLIQLR